VRFLAGLVVGVLLQIYILAPAPVEAFGISDIHLAAMSLESMAKSLKSIDSKMKAK
jgi:hypothetical protein